MVTVASPSVQRTPVSTAHRPADVPLVQYRDGSIYALSLSEPGKVYRVTVAPASCTCKGFQHRQTCCHTKAAAERFGPACAWCGSVEAVAVYVNGFDGGVEVALCAACFSPKGVK